MLSIIDGRHIIKVSFSWTAKIFYFIGKLIDFSPHVAVNGFRVSFNQFYNFSEPTWNFSTHQAFDIETRWLFLIQFSREALQIRFFALYLLDCRCYFFRKSYLGKFQHCRRVNYCCWGWKLSTLFPPLKALKAHVL